MRREGRQHGWVRAYYSGGLSKRELKRRLARPMEGEMPNGCGYIRAPRKPTNHSKFTGGVAFGKMSLKEAAAPSYSKGSLKFKHDEAKTVYLEAVDALDGGGLDDLYYYSDA